MRWKESAPAGVGIVTPLRSRRVAGSVGGTVSVLPGARERRATHRAGGAAQVELVQTQLVLKLMLLNICGLFPPSCSS